MRRTFLGAVTSGMTTVVLCTLGGCRSEPPPSPTPDPTSPGETVDYFSHAKEASEQFDSGDVPQVVAADEGDAAVVTLAVSDGQSSGWDTGKIVAVEKADGSIGYELVLSSIPLDGGQVAAITRDLGVLAAVEQAEISIERTVSLTGAASSPAKTGLAKTVTILDQPYNDQVDLVDLSGTSVYTDPQGRFTIEIDEGYVHFYPDVRIELKIDKPGGGFFDLVDDILDDITSTVAELTDMLRQQGDIDGVVDTFEELIEMSEALDGAVDLGNSLEALAAALVDPSRIELARVRVAGTLDGKFTLQTTTTGEWDWDQTVDLSDVVAALPIRVPVSGPLPVFLTLNVMFKLDMGLDGQIDVTTGFEFETQVDATVALENGSLTLPTEGVVSTPEFRRIGPEIDADAGFSARSGVIPQVGVSLAEILEVTIDPELYLECDASSHGTLSGDGTCVTLDWELYAGLDADVTASVDLLSLSESVSVYTSSPLTLAGDTWESEGCAEQGEPADDGDGYEPDHDSTQATSILAGETQTHSIIPVGDEDWLQFTLSGTLDVVVETSGSSGDTRLWLYDSALTEVAYDDDGGTEQFSRIEQSDLPSGTYYIKVDEFNGDQEIEAYNILLSSVTSSGQTGSGLVSGLVADAIGGAALPDVTVSIYREGALISESTTGDTGTFSIEVPAASAYQVTASKAGYISETYYNIDVGVDEEVYLEPILQIADEYAGVGDFGGSIINALDGSGVSGMSIAFRRGVNARTGDPIATATSADQGLYSVSQLEAGTYTGEITGAGYVTSYFTATCIGGMTNAGQDGEVTPILEEGETRIVLTWGETPPDLDSHLTGPTFDGTRFHVYYASGAYAYDGVTQADLDLDDTSSYGPETITIYQQIDGPYRYSVHDFSNGSSLSSTTLSSSGAQVKVYAGSGLAATFNVPADQGGTLWTVFELNGDQITPVNDMSYEQTSGNVSRRIVETDARLIRGLPAKN